MVVTSQQPARIEFTNHLMFNAVLTENEDICMRLIEEVIGRRVESIEFLDFEHQLQPQIDTRGARLDILACVDGEYVDIEMQVGREPDIARRCRFYHGAMASRFTPKGVGYADVPKSYVIFICVADPFDKGHPRYELATTCLSDPSVPVDDGATTIILNASAWTQERNPEVAGMLEYAVTGRFSGKLAEDIASAVDEKNLDRRWVRASMGIMTYEHEFEVLNRELEKRRAQVEAAQAQVEAVRAQAETTQAELESARAEAQAAQAQVEAARAQAETTQAELDSARAQAQATQAEVDSARAQAEATQAEVDSARAQAEAVQAQVEALQVQAAAADSLQALSKKLYGLGRIDEFFAALDDPKLMEALLAEFAE